MRIVTCCTGHCSAALQEAGRLSKPIRLIHDFKPLNTFGARLTIEMYGVFGEWLAWAIREDAAVETTH
jgi:hypothetical protein